MLAVTIVVNGLLGAYFARRMLGGADTSAQKKSSDRICHGRSEPHRRSVLLIARYSRGIRGRQAARLAFLT